MDAETGAVIALASNPTYSLDTWVGGISTAAYQNLSAGCQGSSGACPLNDYAIQGLYTPGSTFKLATATAALQTGLIGPETTINDTGTFTIKTTTCKTGGPGCSFKDNTASDAGRVNVSAALTKSDDYFFYTLGYRFYKTAGKYGANAIQKTANSYGFGELTTVDLPDEAQGRVDSADRGQKAPPGDTEELPEHNVVRREQHRDGLRPGRHRRHADRGGAGLRHVRQRRHPVPAPGGVGDRLAGTARSSSGSRPRSRERSHSPRPTTPPWPRGSPGW